MSQKKNVATVTTEVYELLEKLESEERVKVVKAALTLLGDDTSLIAESGSKPGSTLNKGGSLEKQNEQEYFDQKDPKTKIEELAVAARFRELFQNMNTHEKKDLKDVTDNARWNFDSRNFKRDLENAKRRNFFTRGQNITLAHYGQKYIDALPDREAVKGLRKPRAQKKTSKKKATKKKSS